jgi:thiamine-monophosphate kinase
VPLGVGDDAAVVTVGGTPVAVTTDALVDGVHFDRSVSSTEDIGWKAIAVNVSDLAAIAATPVAAVVALHLPATSTDDVVDGLYRGLTAAADRWGAPLVGGDIVSSPVLALGVTVVGTVAQDGPLRRDGARPGDQLLLLGRLGLAAAGLALHRAGASEELVRHPELLAAHRRPEALVEVGAALAEGGANACIDVSDGLGRDAAHVARASGVHLVLNESAIPLHDGVVEAQAALGDDLLAFSGGEDFALLATVGPGRVDDLRRALSRVGESLDVVGHVEEGEGVTFVRADGRRVAIESLGYEHRSGGSGGGRR